MNEEEIKEMGEEAIDIIKTIKEKPRINEDDIKKDVGLSRSVMNDTLEDLVEKKVIIRMTTSSASSMESRVPTKIYMLNPQIDFSFLEKL